jgi:hypothetical protein
MCILSTSTPLYLYILSFIMVTLDHQNFWQPTPNSPQRSSSVGSDTQTVVVAEQLIASGETREGGYYSLKNNVPQEERGVENFGGSHS